ncbi:nitroreductase [Pseudomonas sp. OIL-1]|uniref:nitroreductase family protein n=1 Tax=Pseudomonas sp. OIL-1 TaxID=2706126 RepID=UPI0013A73186|nr:nitroreductase [Pseudomonas sp. OIL-1]QIB51675.1 nitroreductase [Pseudomonas sp. OIL-1]
MDALKALHERVSVPRLTGPVPTAAQRDALFKAALRAPDHAYLRPWRFLVVEGEGLERLGELFGRAALAQTRDLSPDTLARYQGLPLRAPLMIIAIGRHFEHPKVPMIEQDMSCGVAVGNMLVAAHAMGLGAVWRTGDLAYDPIVREGLGLADDELIAAFLYVGYPAGMRKNVPHLDIDDFFQSWPES